VLDREAGRARAAHAVQPEPALLAPGLGWVDVRRVLRANVLEGTLSLSGAQAALADPG
jgi:hypothetical protein